MLSAENRRSGSAGASSFGFSSLAFSSLGASLRGASSFGFSSLGASFFGVSLAGGSSFLGGSSLGGVSLLGEEPVGASSCSGASPAGASGPGDGRVEPLPVLGGLPGEPLWPSPDPPDRAGCGEVLWQWRRCLQCVRRSLAWPFRAVRGALVPACSTMRAEATPTPAVSARNRAISASSPDGRRRTRANHDSPRRKLGGSKRPNRICIRIGSGGRLEQRLARAWTNERKPSHPTQATTRRGPRKNPFFVLVFRWSWMPYRGLDASVVGWLPFLRFLRAASSSRMHWRADRTRSAAGGEPFRREAQRQQHPRAIS